MPQGGLGYGGYKTLPGSPSPYILLSLLMLTGAPAASKGVAGSSASELASCARRGATAGGGSLTGGGSFWAGRREAADVLLSAQ